MTKEKSNEMKVHDEKIQESITTKTIVLPLASNIDNAKMNFSEKVCQFFLRGSCQRENCEFKHEKPEKSSYMKDPDKETVNKQLINTVRTTDHTARKVAKVDKEITKENVTIAKN